VTGAFDDEGEPIDPVMRMSLDITLDDLAWWSSALKKARDAGELAPGVLRMQAAKAAIG
jgi:hypothetical protein